jgi:phytoene synthase
MNGDHSNKDAANPPRDARVVARRILAHHSKSFALAGLLLPAWCRQDATALYAWCRRCDDAVDTPKSFGVRATAVSRLHAELGDVYAGAAHTDPVLAGFQDVVRRHNIPRRYADDLIAGMAMDIGVVRYQSFDHLLLYCYRVAGTVGLMMAHIMRVRDPVALRRANDLGIAMQLTNICRDVAEDEQRDRVYLPQDSLGGSCDHPTHNPRQSAYAVAELLRRANDFYCSGDAGLAALPLRCALAIRAARLIYADIGRTIAARAYNVLAGRAVVSKHRKIWLVLRAGGTTAATVLRAWRQTSTKPRRAPQALPFALPINNAADNDNARPPVWS